MAKMHKLTKGGQTIFPATIYDAVVNSKTRKSLATEISELERQAREITLFDKYIATNKKLVFKWDFKGRRWMEYIF